MSSYAADVARRREALVARADQDRTALAAVFGGVRERMSVADTLVGTARRMYSHRVLVGLVSVLAIVAPLATRKWIRRTAWFLPLVIEGVRMARKRSTPAG